MSETFKSETFVSMDKVRADVLRLPKPGMIIPTEENIVEHLKSAGLKVVVNGNEVSADLSAYQSSIIENRFWDVRGGRICRNEFIDSRGRKDRQTEMFTFDDKGRLVERKMLIIPPDGQEPIVDSSNKYQYLEGRPDVEYTDVVYNRGGLDSPFWIKQNGGKKNEGQITFEMRS